MLDTLAVWEQGYEINRVINSYEEGGTYLFQSQCNLGATYIQFGRLDIAEKFLQDALYTNLHLKDNDHEGRILGYIGLVQHLRGNLPAGERYYTTALEMVRNDGGNSRAESIILKHHSDLKMQMNDFTGAYPLIIESRGLAESARYPELIAQSRLSLGQWLRRQQKPAQARREYEAALAEARRIGAGLIESEALSELSRLSLEIGDPFNARRLATASLKIANRLVLGLRQTHGLVVLGRATIQSGLRDLGRAYLRHAQQLADRQGYWLRGHEAEVLLERDE
jgi:tetratricopeptide (TPR) repeat protein